MSAQLSQPIKILFASADEQLIPQAIEHMRQLLPELPLIVVSEFPADTSYWLPFPVSRGLRENLALFRWRFRDNNIRISAVILQPHVPYWRMRIVAFLLSPRNFLAFNENFGHFMLRPRSLGTIIRHLLWRARNFAVSECSPRGRVYTLLWRIAHPSAFRLPWHAFLARIAGRVAVGLKAAGFRTAARAPAAVNRPNGISVVIPSRKGRELLAGLLPEAEIQIQKTGGRDHRGR